ncbi:MAG: SDR family NAD(P)-dependent oxidoreductase [Armatimonadetes bacterium]|nr:SDR family NAD(P)-dependent oxidoreductase [Armatimonadota bacterium]
MAKFRRAIVVGGTSGLGYELVLQLLQRKCRVAAIGRNIDSLKPLQRVHGDLLISVEHDVRDYSMVPELFQQLCGELDGLDLIIYCAGLMPPVAINEFDFEKDLGMIETNVSGAVAWINQAALRFQNTRRGTIVGIGSVAGDRGRAGQPVYNASKAFLHVYLESVRNRLAKHRVRVTSIKPGPMATNMTAHLDQRKMMTVDEAATRVLKLAGKQGEFYLNWKHMVAMAIIKRLPGWVLRRIRL